LVLNRDERTVNFEFVDVYGGPDSGTITIKDIAGDSASQLKFNSIGQSSPFQSGLMVHRRATVNASLNDDRTGLKLTDLVGGELRIT